VTAQAPRALAIDLDGTLVATDVLIESILALVARNPLVVFPLLGWALAGKGELKRRVAARIAVDAPRLPYAPRVVALAREARAAGREVVLATGAARAARAAPGSGSTTMAPCATRQTAASARALPA
jgi:hypothetical protein